MSDSEIVPGIVADRNVAFGKPVIAGTRVSAALVLGQLAGGISEDEIKKQYDLSHEQIQAALRYAAWLANQELLHAR
jgi:uncharacterized protein (DUF433 family)